MTIEILRVTRRLTVAVRRIRVRSNATGVRLLASAAAMIGVSIPLAVTASADPGDGSLLSDLAIGSGGAMSQLIAQFATSLCPMLGQPGSQLVSTGATASGRGGLGSQLAGGVAGLAIQTQCPSFMTSLANGDFSVLKNAASMLGMAMPAASSSSSVTGAIRGLLATPGS
jgi:hypothetical protein